MRITIIGPGIMQIPPVGWGATEILINDHAIKLKELGHQITVVNEINLEKRKKLILKSNPQIIHLHYEDYLSNKELFPNANFYFTAHYPYTDQYIKYSSIFKSKYKYKFLRFLVNIIPNKILILFRFDEVLLSLILYFPKFIKIISNSNKKIICISKNNAETYKSYGYSEKLFLFQNYINEKSISFQKSNFNHLAICVGKIESRKNQSKLQKINKLFFVGPIADKSFDHKNKNYLGEWNREELYRNLTSFSTLVLLSKGEAHALVVPEALVAGLGVVVSEEASANLDRNMEFIDVVPLRYIQNISYLNQIIENNIKKSSSRRKEIREYGIKNFSLIKFAEEYPPLYDDNK